MNERGLMKQGEDIVRLQEQITGARKDIGEIKDHHLVYIAGELKEVRESLSKINIKLASWSGGIVVALWMLEKFVR